MQFDILYDEETLYHNFICGSSAEFYIRPITTCIDDVDAMTFFTNCLVFRDDIPTLPDDFCGLFDTICCFQMTPYPNYPGFVKLKKIGILKYYWNCRKFQFHKVKKLQCLYANKNSEFLNVVLEQPGNPKRGPAVKYNFENSDQVPCFWCPQWPKEAQDWRYRRREYGWPTPVNIHDVVQNGCHVVIAKHPSCKDDDHQYRLSFSAAEVILLQSWTPVQQIVYHMLRFFAKRELINKNCPKEDEVLCTYHFKTLMLWSCEEMSPKWWNSSFVIEICCNLLEKLARWLKEKRCRNYFIPQANLFHKGMNKKLVDETIGRLNKVSKFGSLNVWFAYEYISPIVKIVLTSEDTTEPEIDVEHFMLRICKFWMLGSS